MKINALKDFWLLFIDKHRFKIFISLSLLITFGLVVVSMLMYSTSGAAQLDLSRPGYVSIRSQADSTLSNYRDFPTTGQISLSVIDEFLNTYRVQSKKILEAKPFSGDPLSPEALGIGAVF